ncbi:PREDICTED: ribonuclease Z, mitochondrial [Dinoponera quadriceps]|uniref:Zinc phosphodiesterase ELAC protein 2 n=1 Tax=Dinoponera quadriceps TaxID=609295 RepID=A0A6P3WXA8_DINQU|nr:PREDICTED: ribonuclease Z, mitochondrial [Dinoponera quadriceps]
MKSNAYSLARRIIQCKHVLTLVPSRAKDCNFQRNFASYYKNMPRSNSRIYDIQKLRQKMKGKSIKYTSSANVSLQILGSGAYGAPRCVYLSAGHISYLFNCGEGTQKLAHEHKYRLVKLEHVFITSANWENLGGMPGMLLTIQEAGVPEINIHGPKGTVEIFDAIKRFVYLHDLKVREATCDESQSYTDQVMSVSYIPIAKSTVQDAESVDLGEAEMVDNINYYDYLSKSSTEKIFKSMKEKKNKSQTIGQNSCRKLISQAMSYICKLHPRQGKLLLEKCVEKGVKPGPVLGQLKAGEDVTLPDGTVILSKDVCSPPIPGPIFLVVECPSEDYLESFISHPAFARHQTSEEDNVPHCVVHFTPQQVMDDPRYVNWMEKFSSYTRHIIVNEENKCMGTESSHKRQHQLHMLHPEIFPFLNADSFQKKTRAGDPCIVHRSRTNHTVHLLPELKFDTENEVSLHPKEYVNEIFEVNGFLDALAELQTNINAQTKALSIVNDYPKILVLGTGSSIPNKVRNTSGIILQIDENHSILLDCSEGTFGQIAKFSGRSEVDDIMRSIKAIYVSHLHADHHIGLIGLMKQRRKVTQDPLYLLAPAHIVAWLQMYHKRFEPILHQITLISNNEFFMDVHRLADRKYNNMYKTLNVRAVRTVYVKHCPYSYGVSIELNNGKKIVYSGDTMPCENLVKLGQDCDLLIHEATLEDDLAKEAKLKFHSTVSQAIQAGENMRSKFTLLTHFSQRYAAIPHLPENENDTRLRNVGIAYDYMHVSLSQLPLLPFLYPALKIMFSKHYVELEERAAKRQRLMN